MDTRNIFKLGDFSPVIRELKLLQANDQASKAQRVNYFL